MDRGIGRYILIFFVVMFIFIFGVVKLFGGHKPAPVTRPSEPVVKSLPEYSDTYAEVSMTIDGRINGEDAHRAIRVTVDKFQRRLDIIQGYNGKVIETHSFDNNEQAYNIYLHSLNNSGFMAKIKNPKVTDVRGQCPLGTRTTYELNDSGDVLSQLWTTSCGVRTGTFAGASSTVTSLFKAQITDYDKIISNAKVVL